MPRHNAVVTSASLLSVSGMTVFSNLMFNSSCDKMYVFVIVLVLKSAYSVFEQGHMSGECIKVFQQWPNWTSV